MAVGGRYFPLLVPVTDACFAEEIIRRGDRAAVPLLRASIDALYSSELLADWVGGTTFLVEALLEGGTDSDVQEAEAAVERLSTLPVLDGWAYRDLILLHPLRRIVGGMGAPDPRGNLGMTAAKPLQRCLVRRAGWDTQ